MLMIIISSFSSQAQMFNATIAGKSGGEITIKQLLNDSMLTVKQPGYDIIKFRMSAYGKGLTAIEIETDGSRLTDLMRRSISDLRTGDKLYFEYIKAKSIKGDTLMVMPIGFTIN